MAHHFIQKTPEESPWYREELMEKFRAVREITSMTRPPGTHGCQLVEIVPGLWTAHFEDINKPDSFVTLPITPPMGLVVNSAVAYGQCETSDGFYEGGIKVLRIELYDDPKEGEPRDAPTDAREHFDLINESIRATIAEGKSALVHCMASLSRSVCLIIAYLMDTEKMSLLDATSFVKAKWDATWPNHSFIFQLIDYETELNAKR